MKRHALSLLLLATLALCLACCSQTPPQPQKPAGAADYLMARLNHIRLQDNFVSPLPPASIQEKTQTYRMRYVHFSKRAMEAPMMATIPLSADDARKMQAHFGRVQAIRRPASLAFAPPMAVSFSFSTAWTLLWLDADGKVLWNLTYPMGTTSHVCQANCKSISLIYGTPERSYMSSYALDQQTFNDLNNLIRAHQPQLSPATGTTAE